MLRSPVYILKASFRLPFASNWAELSKLKTNSVNPISQINSEFWSARNLASPKSDENLFGGIVDSPFFADISTLGIGHNEWSCLDPQQRLCLSLAQELTSDLTLPQETSVFIGASDTGWSQHNTLPSDNRYLLAGSHLSMTSARISYHFDLNGKSKTIDTSCSSSLVAIAEAFESISSGDSHLSICGGVNLFNDPFKFAQLRRMQMLSPDHQCFTFKKNANGYVRSEGGILFLLASENSLHKYNLLPLARINGCFVNHDGLSAGITAPSLQSQVSLHRSSLSASALQSSDISYIECHGTGTPLGDPIELKALNAVFNTEDVFVGSIKSKVGHLEAAAGAAGVLNCLSFFQDHHFARVDTTPSTDKFAFSDSSLIHSDDNIEFKNKQSFSKSTLVSSFGFSGTNASLIMSPSLSDTPSSSVNVGLFPGQGRFDIDLGTEQYNTSPFYRCAVDSYWDRLRSTLSSLSLVVPSTFVDRSFEITPLFQQYICLIHLLSLYDTSLREGIKYDYLIGYSFGEYAASVASSSLSFEDCIRALHEREKLVEPHRGLFNLYYIEYSNLTPAILEKYLPKEVITCSPSSSIYAISSIFFEQIKSSQDSTFIKFVGVDYCYHSSILIDQSCLSDSFLDIKFNLANSNFLPSWNTSSSLESDWSIHLLEQIKFNKLLSRVSNLSSSDLSIVEISSKPTLQRIVSQNLPSLSQYSIVQFSNQFTSVQTSEPCLSDSSNTEQSITSFILDFISQCSGLTSSSIDISKTFTRCGLDSLELAQLVSKLYTNFSISFSLDELVGSFHVINEAIQEAVRRFSVSSDIQDSCFVTPSSISPPLSSRSSVTALSSPSSESQPESVTQPHSRQEIVHSVVLRDFLINDLKGSCFKRDSFSSLADPRYSAGFSSIYRDYQVPLVAESASGAHVTSIDGLKYLDFTMGFGVQIFGHNPPFVQSSLLQAIENNFFFLGPQSSLASLNSKLLCDLTCHDRALFCNTGTEAVMTAVRLARAFTERRKILMFNASYHGHNDFTLAAQSDLQGHTSPSSIGTPPSYLSDTLIGDYSDLESITQLVHDNKSDLAAILVEPIQSRKPSVDVVKTLKLLRKLCDDFNIVLIFDEVLIGFRCHYQSTFGYFGVKSDLSTYGKIIGGGLPIGAVAGNAHIMNLVDGGPWYQSTDVPSDQRIFFAGTFNKNPLTMISCHQILTYIATDKGKLQNRLNNLTRRTCRRLNKFFISKGVQIRIAFASSVFRFTGAPLAFYMELLARKIYIWEGRTCFLSTEHSETDLEYFESSVCSATDSLIADGVLDSPDFAHQDNYLLATTQLSLCASYAKLPDLSQSFNQLVSISDISPSEFPSFLNKAVTCINSEIALFGTYDLVKSKFIPSSNSSDWIRYYSDESYEWNDFHPSDICHVQCVIVFEKNVFKEIHFCFAHYAIDGKGINDLFLRILDNSNTSPPPVLDSTQSVDLTDYLLSILSNDHFRYLSRGSSLKRFHMKLPSAVRLHFVDISERYSVTLPSILLAFYINSIQSRLSLKSLVVAIFGTNLLYPRDAYLYDSFISPVPLVINDHLDFIQSDLSDLQHTLSKLVVDSYVDTSTIVSKFNISSSSFLYPLTSFAFNFDKISPTFSKSSANIEFNKFPPAFPRWNAFLNVVDDLDTLTLSLDYNPDLINEQEVTHIIDNFLYACTSFASSVDNFSPFLHDISSVHHDEAPQFTDLFEPKNYLSALVSDLSVHSIRSTSRSITSDELKDIILSLSPILSQSSEQIYCIRSSDITNQFITILACWHFGKAYILWNPLESDDVNRSRMADCGVHLLINFDDAQFSLERLPAETSVPSFIDSFDSLAHIIYTSGSTGNPKPVPVSINHLAAYQSSIFDRIPLSRSDDTYRFGVLSSLNYDFSFTTILLWLKHGGELFLGDYQEVKSPVFWSNIPANFFSFLKILPPFFSSLSEFVPIHKLLPTDVLVFGGDNLRNTIAKQCFSERVGLSIYTHYGPTETCIGCSTFPVPRKLPIDGFVPVGAALEGYEFSIEPIPDDLCDKDFSSSYSFPVGLIFIHTNNSYGSYFDGSTESHSHADSLVTYRTGDIGFLDDGVLNIVGRISGFLKINGFRVYLSDINQRILNIYPDLSFHLLPLPHVSDISQSDQFVMFYSHSELDQQAVESVLRRSLAPHLCPQRVFKLLSIPLTSNGKVNTSSLNLFLLNHPKSTPNVSDPSETPTSVSDFLSSCSAIFGSVELNLNSNFFQLGGDSLTSIRLSASFNRSGYDLSSEVILSNPDFSELYQIYLSSRISKSPPELTACCYHLTPSQSYFLHFFDPSRWYFTFLIDCTTCPSFVDNLTHSLINSNFTSFSFNSSGQPSSSSPSSIPVFERTYPSRSAFFSDLNSVADSAVISLKPASAINACLTLVRVEDDHTLFCLCAFPHFLIDYLSVQILLDSSSLSLSDIQFPLGFPSSSITFPPEVPSHFIQIQKRQDLICGDDDFRYKFSSDSYLSCDFILDVPSGFSQLSTGYAIQFLPYLIASVNTTLTADQDGSPLIDLEFGLRDYPDILCSGSIGYFSIHLPCLFDDYDVDSLAQRLRNIQISSTSLFSYLSKYPETISATPICSINCIDSSVSGSTTLPKIIGHSLSSSESFPLPWAPLMLEVECTTSNFKLKLYFDNKQINRSTVDSLIDNLKSFLVTASISSDDPPTDIMNRLGW